ncbi:MAG: heme-binding domain-containing protein [Bacteroidota bacterium]
MTSKRKKTIFWAVLIFLLLIQFFPIDKTNPPFDLAEDYLQISQPPIAVQQMIKAACYDCHSHQTVYPWYTNIQPIGKWIKGHVEYGKENLNFSLWANYSPDKAKHKLEECIEVMENGRMPMKSYTWTHPDAKLDESQQTELIAWFKNQYEQ